MCCRTCLPLVGVCWPSNKHKLFFVPRFELSRAWCSTVPQKCSKELVSVSFLQRALWAPQTVSYNGCRTLHHMFRSPLDDVTAYSPIPRGNKHDLWTTDVLYRMHVLCTMNHVLWSTGLDATVAMLHSPQRMFRFYTTCSNFYAKPAPGPKVLMCRRTRFLRFARCPTRRKPCSLSRSTSALHHRPYFEKIYFLARGALFLKLIQQIWELSTRFLIFEARPSNQTSIQ